MPVLSSPFPIARRTAILNRMSLPHGTEPRRSCPSPMTLPQMVRCAMCPDHFPPWTRPRNRLTFQKIPSIYPCPATPGTLSRFPSGSALQGTCRMLHATLDAFLSLPGFLPCVNLTLAQSETRSTKHPFSSPQFKPAPLPTCPFLMQHVILSCESGFSPIGTPGPRCWTENNIVSSACSSGYASRRGAIGMGIARPELRQAVAASLLAAASGPPSAGSPPLANDPKRRQPSAFSLPVPVSVDC